MEEETSVRFQVTDEQRDLREEVREFAREKIEPKAKRLDRREEYPADVLAEAVFERYS